MSTLFPGITGASDTDPSLRIRASSTYSTAVPQVGATVIFTLESVKEGRVITFAEHMRYRIFTRQNTYDPGKTDLRLELVEGATGGIATQQYRESTVSNSRLTTANVEQTTKFLGIQSIETPAGVFSACGFESTTTNLQVDGPTVVERVVEWIYRGVAVKTDWHASRPADVLTSGQVNDVPIK
ncbi:hypothetical protein [Ottowia thiooxydans]